MAVRRFATDFGFRISDFGFSYALPIRRNRPCPDRGPPKTSNVSSRPRAQRARAERSCAGHGRQLGGESPLPNLVEVKG